MRYYEITVYQQGTLNQVGQGFSGGENALDALETALETGNLHLNDRQEVDIIITNSNSKLQMKIEAYKGVM